MPHKEDFMGQVKDNGSDNKLHSCSPIISNGWASTTNGAVSYVDIAL